MDDKELSFTNVDHISRKKLTLSTNEYCIADAIYHLSNNPDGNGWCYASKGWLASRIGLSEQSIHSILRKLLEKRIVEKHSQTKHLKTTKLWYETVVLPTHSKNFSATKETLVEPLKKLDPTTKETLPNIHTYNNKDKLVLRTNTTFGRDDINHLTFYFKEKLGLPRLDGSVEKNRYLCATLLKILKKSIPNKEPIDVVKGLIDTVLIDEWHKEKCTSFYYLTNNWVRILNGQKSDNQQVLVIR